MRCCPLGRLAVAAMIAACLCGSAAFAQGQQVTAETAIAQIRAAAYRQMEVNPPTTTSRGVVETLRQADTVYLSVDAFVAIEWTDKARSVRTDSRQIVLVDGDGKTIPPIGAFRYGYFRRGAVRLALRRPPDWQTEKRPMFFNAVFAVPHDAKSFELRLGQASAKFDVPEPVDSTSPPGDTVRVTIIGSRLVDQVTDEIRLGRDTAPTTITNPAGRILEVRFRLRPLKGNWYGGPASELGAPPHRFFWSAAWIGVACDDGYYTPRLGEKSEGKINSHASHNPLRGEDGKWAAEEATFYFAVPEKVKTFKLLYLMKPVAEGTVGK